MRQADSTIKGYLYQFNKSIDIILDSNDDVPVVLEGVIEDIDVHMPDPVPNSSNVNVFDEWNKDWIDIVFDDVIRRWRKE